MTTPNNLPAEVSSFIGREEPLADLRKLLRKSRLITLTGPGGAGKTRLALRAAQEVLERFPDGVWLVELAPVADSRLLDQVVSFACGIREQRRHSPRDHLVKTLATSRVLIILDGCEHLVDESAALVSRLLGSCPRLTVLVTSREPLGIHGEVIWRVPSLTVPNADSSDRAELLLQSESVRLFIERARLSHPRLELDATTSPAVAEICRRLEGIPLAIELAAGLTRVLTFDDILVRLHDRFRLLTGGSRTALPRHQTLRAAVDWSFGLMKPDERALLVRLCVFAGGFDLAAAEAIAGHESKTTAVLPLLARLVDKSLVVAEEGERPHTRYRILDTIREYASEHSSQRDKAEGLRRHSKYFAGWCARAAAEIRGRDQVDWLKRLDDEQGNIRLALEWSLADAPEVASRICGAMGRYWIMRGHIAEGLDWLDRVIGEAVPDGESKAAALIARAHLRWTQGDYDAARNDACVSAEMSRSAGPHPTLFIATTLLAIVNAGSGDWAAAARLHDEAFQIAWQLRDPWWVASSLNNLGLVAMERGDFEVARARFEQALESLRLAGDRFSTAMSLDSLARVNIKLANFAAARSNYLEALTVSCECGDVVDAAIALEGLGQLEHLDGRPGRAIQLMSAAVSLRRAVGSELAPEFREPVDRSLAEAKAAVSPGAAEHAWKQGAQMNIDEAVRFATGAQSRTADRDGGPLTARERQVALLITDGLTNAQIAARLKMAERTADAHVEHIRNKLGLRTRAQIAVWAHERIGTS